MYTSTASHVKGHGNNDVSTASIPHLPIASLNQERFIRLPPLSEFQSERTSTPPQCQDDSDRSYDSGYYSQEHGSDPFISSPSPDLVIPLNEMLPLNHHRTHPGVTSQPASPFSPPLPVITRISPNSGPTSGGIEINLHGCGFLSSPTWDVSFGENKVATLEVLSDTAIILRLPPSGSPGDVFVSIRPMMPADNTMTAVDHRPKVVFRYVEDTNPELSVSRDIVLYIADLQFNTTEWNWLSESSLPARLVKSGLRRSCWTCIFSGQTPLLIRELGL